MPFTQSLQILLQQLNLVLQQLSDEAYKQPVPILSNASIGQHVRHVIELFQELAAGYDSGIVNYDKRKRDYILETNRQTAMAQLLAMPSQFAKPDCSLLLAGSFAVDGEAILVSTNYKREVLYNIEHTVHHMALIRVALNNCANIHLPEGFGIAASTQTHQQTCAQ